jgi:hypothetical protein
MEGVLRPGGSMGSADEIQNKKIPNNRVEPCYDKSQKFKGSKHVTLETDLDHWSNWKIPSSFGSGTVDIAALGKRGSE